MKTALIILLVSINSFAATFECKIRDLATAQDFVVLEIENTSLSKLMELPEHEFSLSHHLMSANINLTYNDTVSPVFILKIEAYEVVNRATEKFIIPVDTFLKTGRTKLGHVFNEITGLGDNTMTSCSWVN